MKAAQIRQPVTILFADVRNYTSLSTNTDAEEVSAMLGQFYEACGETVWLREGIINKVIGDAVLALFNFPFRREDHIMKTVDAAIEIQRRCREQSIDVGIGIHTGETLIGEVGQYVRDFTVIGPVVNLASRLQSAAHAGEILVTDEVFEEAADLLPGAEERNLELKGLDEPVHAYAFLVEETQESPLTTTTT